MSDLSVTEKPYLYEVGPDLVHGAHLKISQEFKEHDHLFHTAAPSVEYLSFKIVEIQLKLLCVRPVQRYRQEIFGSVFEATKSASKASNVI